MSQTFHNTRSLDADSLEAPGQPKAMMQRTVMTNGVSYSPAAKRYTN